MLWYFSHMLFHTLDFLSTLDSPPFPLPHPGLWLWMPAKLLLTIQSLVQSHCLNLWTNLSDSWPFRVPLHYSPQYILIGNSVVRVRCYLFPLLSLSLFPTLTLKWLENLKSLGCVVRLGGFKISFLLLAYLVTFGQLLSLFEPQFSQLWNSNSIFLKRFF